MSKLKYDAQGYLIGPTPEQVEANRQADLRKFQELIDAGDEYERERQLRRILFKWPDSHGLPPEMTVLKASRNGEAQ